MEAQYKLGLSIVDDEHAKLFDLNQRLASAPADEALILASELYDYVFTHLVHEEQLLQGWEFFDVHVSQHKRLTFVLDNIFEKLNRPMFIDIHGALEELRTFVDEWLRVHILQEDAQYVGYLKSMGYA